MAGLFGNLGSGAQPHDPAPTIPQERVVDNPLDVDALGLALYSNGKLVPVEAADVVVDEDGVTVSIVFRTSRNCLRGAGDPRVERAWGGFKSGDYRFLLQPHPVEGKVYPDAGYVMLEEVVIPADEGGQVQFRVKALTPVYDWRTEKQLAAAGDDLSVPAEWVLKGHD